MKIGILGTGNIGKTLVHRLSEAGHDVKAANSRGPESIGPDILSSGGRAVTAEDAAVDVDVVILSIPFNKTLDVAPLLAGLPDETVVIDTSNYYPGRDGRIEAVEAGQVESLWMAEQLGRPIGKAWNAIATASLADKGKPTGAPGRIALPVAADQDEDRRITLALVEDTGLHAFDAGSLAHSGHQQPGAPAYCTDLNRDELDPARAAAKRVPKRRDLARAAMMERLEDAPAGLDPQYLPRLNRARYM